MARVQFTSIISNATGSVAGTTFQRGNGSSVIRTKSYKRGRVGASSLRQRQLIQYLSQQWRLLTDDQRAAWFHPPVLKRNAHGEAKQITLKGLPLFLYCNINVVPTGHPLLTVPAGTYQILTWHSVEIVIQPSPGFIAIEAINLDGTGLRNATIKVSRGYSPGTAVIPPDTGMRDRGVVNRGSLLKKPRVIAKRTIASGTNAFFINAAEYAALFGNRIPGTVVCVELFAFNQEVGIPGPSYLRAALVDV